MTNRCIVPIFIAVVFAAFGMPAFAQDPPAEVVEPVIEDVPVEPPAEPAVEESVEEPAVEVEQPPAVEEILVDVDVPGVPAPTIRERVNAVHADLMTAVATYEDGGASEANVQARVAAAEAELAEAEAERTAVLEGRAADRDALIELLRGIILSAGALVIELETP